MPRTDPTDTGGLFVGRRPGTRPVHYRGVPERATGARLVLDRVVAGSILAVMILICVSFWGPVPVGWMWIGSQVDYWTNSAFVGIITTFLGLLLTLFVALMLVKRLDSFWILVRRATGHDQKEGATGRIFAIASIIGGTIFMIWLLGFSGARLSGGGIGG